MLDFSRIQLKDRNDIFNARNDPAIMRWCRQYAPLHYDDHIAWMDKQRKDPSIDMFIFKRLDVFCGVCGLTDIDLINRRAEFSLYVNPGEQGKGYATYALKWLFNYGFKTLNLNRIWGETFDGNPALKLFTDKLGMGVDGTRKEFYYKNGIYIDAHLVSIGRDKWLLKNS